MWRWDALPVFPKPSVSIIMELHDSFWIINPFNVDMADCPRTLHCVMCILCCATQKWNAHTFWSNSRCRKSCLKEIVLTFQRKQYFIYVWVHWKWRAKIWTISVASYCHFLLVTGCKEHSVSQEHEYNLSRVTYRLPYVFLKQNMWNLKTFYIHFYMELQVTIEQYFIF
jgi:hypothetical protein